MTLNGSVAKRPQNLPGLPYPERLPGEGAPAMGDEAFKREYLGIPGRWPHQPIHLGSVRAGDTDSRPADAAGLGVRAAAEHVEQ